MTIAVLDATGQTQQILSATELSTALAAIVTAVTGTVTSTQPVSGSFFQATQPVSIAAPVAVNGTFFQATQPISAASLPLPTGAATAAGVASVVTALGSPLQAGGAVSVSSSALPTGAATAAGQAATTAAVALTTAAQNYAAITPSDSAAVPNFATIKSLYVSVAGNLVIKGANGTQVTLPVVVGQIVPFAPSFVMAATTATVVALL